MSYWIERRTEGRWIRFATKKPGSAIPELTPKEWDITMPFAYVANAIEACMELREICTGKPDVKSANDGAPWLRIVSDDGEVVWIEDKDIPLAGAVTATPVPAELAERVPFKRLRINEFEHEEPLPRR